MFSRVDMEKREENILSPYACLSKDSKGRLNEELECDLRSVFQHDRDRILHSKAFRRLKHKTQVFIAPEGDHYRTRLTHTLEVSQIARTIARGLILNEDLTEAIALGHDLGHTPFGHAGEEVFKKVSNNKFSHNVHSLRVVDKLEIRSGGKKGLNLSYEVRDGILHHTGDGKPSTLEGKIVRIADRIAYINHDIDDSIRAGILDIDELPKEALNILGYTHSKRIDTMVRDIIVSSYKKNDIKRSKDVKEASSTLRRFLFDNVYIGSRAKTEEDKAQRLLENLFYYYLKNINEIPDKFRNIEEDTASEQIVIDYIAGMSDRFAINKGRELYIPSPWYATEN